jgi:hypothetical protein
MKKKTQLKLLGRWKKIIDAWLTGKRNGHHGARRRRRWSSPRDVSHLKLRHSLSEAPFRQTEKD